MAKFLKIIRTCTGRDTLTPTKSPDPLISENPVDNMFVNLDEVSNITMNYKTEYDTYEVTMWTVKVGLSWRFSKTSEAEYFYQALEERLPMHSISTNNLRGFSNV
jgi:hypothetical protein